MVAGDIDQLGHLLDERLTYTHSTGVVDTKASLLRKIAAGELRYRSIDSLSKTIIAADSVAIIFDDLEMRVVVTGEEHVIRSKGISVWLASGARGWQLLAFQGTKIQ